MHKVKSIISAVCVLVLVVGIYYVSTWETFDAKNYVQAVLDETFQGDVTAAAMLIKDQTVDDLQLHYEDGVEDFLDKNVLSGVEVDDATREKYKLLCQDIFKCMKYEAKQVKVINRREMEVTVEYQQADIFPKFVQALAEDSDEFLENAENATYKKIKKNQIQAQIEKSFLNRSYELLKQSYENVTYGEPETMIFKVMGDKNNAFSVDEAQISELITKILMIDEIKD